MSTGGSNPRTPKPYDRVTLRRRCGRLDDPCPRGPLPSGECSGGAACVPRLEGDRWHCTRPAALGGPCAAGPGPRGECGERGAPCMPRRARFNFRRWLILSVLALAAALALLMVDRGGWRDWLSAGPLSSAHALFEEDCAECHGAAEKEWRHWPLSAWRGDAREDRGRCIACHDRGIEPMRPHGLAASNSPVAATPEHLQCSACHREHRGRDFDATRIEDSVCQACHADLGPGIQGHPSVTLGGRDAHIAFDHASHHGKHFIDENYADRAPAQCETCHAPSPVGLMRSASYANACAACHDDRVWGDTLAGPRGIPLLGLPGLDKETLEANGFAMGAWPAFADRAPLPLLMRLIEADAEMAADYARIGELDWLDLRQANPDQLAAVARLAWAIKARFADLREQGQQALSERLKTADEPVRGRLSAQLAGLSPDLLRTFVDQWLPGLRQELRDHRAGRLRSAARDLAAPVDNGQPQDAGSEAGDDTLLLVPENESTEASGDSLLGDDGDALLSGSQPSDDALLAGELLGDGEALLLDEPTTEEDLLLGDYASLEEDDALLLGAEDSPEDEAWLLAEQTPDELKPPKSPSLRPEERTPLGGWYMDGATLFYRPAGHGDPLLRSWLERVGGGKLPKELSARLAAEDAPGGCAKCHRLDSDNPQWRSQRGERLGDGRTRFDHRPHLGPQNREACLLCHQPDADAVKSGIRYPALDDCAACHKQQAVALTCIACHDYHPAKGE